MTSWRLDYDDDAVEEILAAKEWWYAHRDKAPRALDEDLADAIERITKRPGIGFWVQNALGFDLRRVLLRRCGKHLYYAIEEDRILILALHAARGEGLPDLAGRGKRRH